MGVHRCRRWLVYDALLERATCIGGMRQRLDDDAFLVCQNDVSISKHFHIEVVTTVFCIKIEP